MKDLVDKIFGTAIFALVVAYCMASFDSWAEKNHGLIVPRWYGVVGMALVYGGLVLLIFSILAKIWRS